MGTEARIVLYAARTPFAESAASAAFRRIAEVDSLLSDYREDSELAWLVARAGNPPAPVSRDMLAVLTRATWLASETDGAFDVTVGPLVALWREARRTGRLPSRAALRAGLGRVGWRQLVLDPVVGTAGLARPGMRLDLGGIAKGYAADQGLKVLRERGIGRALVGIGGDIVVGQAPPGARGWRITVEHADSARREVWLERAAISSSGDTEQFVEIGGRRYSHVVDPRTGLGLTHRVAATVVAPDGMSADGFATAVTILDAERRAGFIASHPEATFYVRSVGEPR